MGDTPAFAGRRVARLLVFAAGSRTHLRLYDGRGESSTFTGVTADEASALVTAEHDVDWGAFLDGGRTAKLAVRRSDGTYTTYGNRHYLQWPQNSETEFKWTPDKGRPVGSLITVR